MRTDRDWGTFHLWDLERKCFASYADVLDNVRIRQNRDSKAEALDGVIAEVLSQVR